MKHRYFFVTFLLLLLSLLVSSCGFRPVYRTLAHDKAPLPIAIVVDKVEGKEGHYFGMALERELEPLLTKNGATYHLQIILQQHALATAIQRTGTPTRYSVRIAAHYTLYDPSMEVVSKGSEDIVGSYDVVSSPYATVVAEENTYMLLLNQLSGLLKERLVHDMVKHAVKKPEPHDEDTSS